MIWQYDDTNDDNNTAVGRLAEEFVSQFRVNSVNNVMILIHVKQYNNKQKEVWWVETASAFWRHFQVSAWASSIIAVGDNNLFH